MGNFISFCNPKDDSAQNDFDNFGDFNDFTELINKNLPLIQHLI
jgi:hypothetical protein